MLLVNNQDMIERNVVGCVESLGTFGGHDPSFDPYNLYLENMPEKIILTIDFDYSTDFSKAFDKFRRTLTIISEFIFKCSYLHSSIHLSCMLRCLLSLFEL